MQLRNQIRIARPAAEVFDALLDVERVAGCMPGSKLTGKTEENTYGGEVTVKVGPLTAAYTGTVRYLEIDRAEHRIVLKAAGKERSGQGNADAHVVATVLPDGAACKVSIETDLTIRGKVAQFGRGVIGEVSQRLIGQFASNVEALLTPSATGEFAEAARTGTASAAEPPSQSPTDDHALDGLALMLVPLIKRAAPVATGLVVGIVIGRRSSRHRAACPHEFAPRSGPND